MEQDKIETLLLQLIQDMSFVKAKLSSIEEQRFASRIDNLEAENREHDRMIKSLEHRQEEMEKYSREKMIDTNKAQRSVFISMGIAIFSAMVSLIVGLLF